MARAGTVTIDVEGDYDKFEKDTRRMGKRMGGVLGGAFSVGLGVIAAQAIVGVARKLKDLAVDAVNFASEMQTITMAFEQLGGDAGLRTLETIKNIAKTTPFELKPMLAATQLMMGYGVEAKTAGDLMQVVVDNVAAMGRGEDAIQRSALALGQVQAKGRVLGEELRQLNESGIQAQAALAAHMGITQAEVLDLARAGKITVEDLNGALLSQAGPLAKNAGFAVKATNTVKGALSNLRDAWNITIAESMQPAMDGLTATIRDELQPALEDTAAELGPAFGESFTILADAAGKSLPAISKLSEAILAVVNAGGKGLGPMVEALTPLFGRLMDTFANIAEVAAPMVMAVLEALGGGVLQILLTLLQQLQPILYSILPVMAPLIEMILQLVTSFVTLALEGLGPIILQLVQTLMPSITQLVEGPLADLVELIMSAVLPAFMQILPILIPVIDLIVRLATAILDALIPIISTLVEALMPVLVQIFEALADILLDNEDLLFKLVDAMIPLLEVIAEILVIAIDLISQALEPLLDVVSELATFILDVLINAFDEVGQWFKDLEGAGGELWQGFVEDLEAAWDEIAAFPAKAIQWGEDLINGLLEGMGNIASGIKRWVVDHVVKPIENTVKGWFNIGSPSKVMMEHGRDVMRGFNLGMENEGVQMPFGDLDLPGIAAAGFGQGNIQINTYGPVGGSMAEFAAQIERQRAIEARFAYG